MSNRSRRELLRYYALNYASAGLRVMPCHYVLTDKTCSCGQIDCGKNTGKHPLTRHGIKDATSSLEQVERWWDATPLANIALVPDVIYGTDIEWMALDLDVGTRRRGGKDVHLDGFGDLEALETRFRDDVPRQIIQRTGSGGEHILMLKRHGRLPSALGPAIDVIAGAGKYILAAPSNHVSGYNYEWKNDKSSVGGAFVDRIGRALPKIGYAPQWVMEFDPHSDKVSRRREREEDRRSGEELRALHRRQGTDLSPEEFEEALSLVPNADAPYDEYFALLCAVHHEAAAKDDLDWGYRLAHLWAEKSSKFVQSDFDHRWDSIRDEGNTKTGKYVLMLAGHAGWHVPERGPVGDAVRELNLKHAMVLNGGRGMVVTTDRDADGKEVLAFSDTTKLAPWYANKRVAIPDPTKEDPNKVKLVPKDKLWLTSESRREYSAMVFDPRGSGPGVLNLWRGFSIKPANLKNPADGCWRWLNHIREVIARGDERDAEWIIGWFAHQVQRPWEKLGTALVLIGEMGVGKSVIGEHFGAMIPHHYSVVDKAHQIVGNFNMQLARCLFLQAEEAFWAGDKTAEGSLRHLVSGKDLTIEPKGVDSYKIANYTRLMVTTNHKWAIPAGESERRFATFNVSNRYKQNKAYFRAMEFQMKNGGYEALLQYLMEFDLRKVDLRTIPKTEALLDQKIASADPHVKWLLERLTDGTGWDGDRRGEVDTEEFYAAYQSYCRDHRVMRPLDVRMFAKEMHRLLKTFVKHRAWNNGSRKHVYTFGYLDECREHFEDIMEQNIRW